MNYLDKVNNGAKKNNRVTEAAEALAPAVAKQGWDPEGEEAEPEETREDEVLKSIDTWVCICCVVRGRVWRNSS